MDGMRLLVRLSVAAGVVVLVVLAALPATHETPGTVLAIMKDGAPMPIPNATGYYLGTWNNGPVAVMVVPASILSGVDSYRGADAATPSIAVPGHPDLRMIALSAKSTHLGCTVGFNKGLGASRDITDYNGDGVPDGRMMDPCSQSQWDPYHRGAVLPAQPAKVRLAVLDVAVHGDELVATHYDGPVGAMAR
jgi:Rieske Fe-S protein